VAMRAEQRWSTAHSGPTLKAHATFIELAFHKFPTV